MRRSQKWNVVGWAEVTKPNISSNWNRYRWASYLSPTLYEDFPHSLPILYWRPAARTSALRARGLGAIVTQRVERRELVQEALLRRYRDQHSG